MRITTQSFTDILASCFRNVLQQGPSQKEEESILNQNLCDSGENAETRTDSNAANLSSEIKNIVSEIIPGIIPAITQSVVTSLTQLGVIPKGNFQNQNTEGQTPAFSESDGKGTAEKQGDLGSGEDANDSPLPLQFEINGSNVHSSSGKTASPGAQLIKSDLPESKIVSMARPLGLGVDSKVKS